VATHVALLRGINVGGHRLVSMAELREKLEEAGFADVKTLLQSGNVVFTTKRGNLEPALTKLTGTDVIVRTAAEWRKVMAANPFPEEAANDPARLLVMFLDRKPGPLFAWPGIETMRAAGRELFLYYPEGAGRSKLTGALIEKKLGVRGTARNWNTVLRIANAL
jgi:uncharacterized protein (DUF1697 family)